MHCKRTADRLRDVRATGWLAAMMLATLLLAAPERGMASGTITITYPNGGETLYFGEEVTVRWTASGVGDEVEVEYTVDGGGRWRSVGETSASAGSITWDVPHRPGTNARIRVTTRDGSVSDISDAPFTITENPLEIPMVKTPNGGELWTEGERRTITWQAPADAAQVLLEYSTNGGGAWKEIATVAASPASYVWTVPHVGDAPVPTILVKMSIPDDPGEEDQSDATFTINPRPVDPPDTTKGDTVAAPVVRLLYPNGGERLAVDSLAAIRWVEQDVTGDVELAYSTDGGAAWRTIGTVGAGTGSFLWKVPGSVSDRVLMRIATAGRASADISDATFSIISKTTTPPDPPDEGEDIEEPVMVTPNGGETWREGERRKITWKAPADIAMVRIDLSIDGGVTWTLIDSAAVLPAEYLWTIPHLSNEVITTAKVRVTDLAEADHTDLSDAAFTIEPRAIASAPARGSSGVSSATAAYPNPAREHVTIAWRQMSGGEVLVSLHDDRGVLVGRTALGHRDAGAQSVDLDLRSLPSGVYRYRVESESAMLHGTIIVVR